MDESLQIRKNIFASNARNFEETALAVFRFQYSHNDLYRRFCDLLRRNPGDIKTLRNIPFLPIRFFKSAQIKTGVFDETLYFESSGTTGSINSRHFVKDISVYEESFTKGFTQFYGDPEKRCIIGLLPSYLERKNSSLVYMVDKLISLSENEHSGFYLFEHEKLKDILLLNESRQQPTLLIGVTYALLDFAEAYPMKLKHTTVMETGGMKGRREELSRSRVHEILKEQLGVESVHSEYGMTELLSQAYSKEKGIFDCPPWMKVLIRNEDDPFEINDSPPRDKKFAAGAVNIIDLANLYSCSFIATDDAGKLYDDGSFEITGRLDNSDIRGCGLMII